MPTVLGADPDKKVAWDDDDTDVERPRPPGWTYNRSIVDLVNHFAYNPRMKMSQRCNDDDKSVVANWIVRCRRKGYTDEQIKKAINVFFMSYAAEYSEPAYAIVSNTLQDRIFDAAELMTLEDPIMQWMIAGMRDDGPVDDPRGTRQMVLTSGGQALKRYPYLVWQIISSDSRMFWKKQLVKDINLLIDWKLGQDVPDEDREEAKKRLAPFDPPSTLTSNYRDSLNAEYKSMAEGLAMAQHKRKQRKKK